MGEPKRTSGVDVEGGVDGLVALYDKSVGDIYNFVFRRSGANRELAEDITQETFLSAARHFRLTADVPNAGWLYRVARRRLVDHWRSEARKDRKLRLVVGGRIDDHIDDPVHELASSSQVAESLGELPTSQRAAFVLCHLDGHSTAEAAEALGRSLKATESLLARARQSLAATYPEDGSE